jgi:hypothetical protein
VNFRRPDNVRQSDHDKPWLSSADDKQLLSMKPIRKVGVKRQQRIQREKRKSLPREEVRQAFRK